MLSASLNKKFPSFLVSAVLTKARFTSGQARSLSGCRGRRVRRAWCLRWRRPKCPPPSSLTTRPTTPTLNGAFVFHRDLPPPPKGKITTLWHVKQSPPRYVIAVWWFVIGVWIAVELQVVLQTYTEYISTQCLVRIIPRGVYMFVCMQMWTFLLQLCE